MKSSIKILILISLVIGAFFGGVYLSKPSKCGAFCDRQLQTVTASEFSKLTSDNKITIIDVRTPDEYETGHIAKAVNYDFSNQVQFSQHLDSLDKNGNYLIYCRSGNRSGQALKLMEEKGFSRVTNLSGGILSWQSAGFPIVK